MADELLTADVIESPAVVPNEVAQSEKILPQERVNALVGEAKSKGYQKGYQEALAAMGHKPAEAHTPASAQNTQDIAGIVQREMAKQQQQQAEAMRQAQVEAEGKRIINELQQKVAMAQGKHDDFDDVTKQVDFTQVPEVLHYANLVDNGGDVLYDLAKNPAKIATLRGLPPSLAAMEVRRMSESIKANESAVANPPNLRDRPSQIKSSPVQTVSDGNMSVSDFRASLRAKKY